MMRRMTVAILMGAVAVSSAGIGCGVITAQSLMIKGAQWAATEVVKKEIKHLRKHKEKPASRPASVRDTGSGR